MREVDATEYDVAAVVVERYTWLFWEKITDLHSTRFFSYRFIVVAWQPGLCPL